MATITISDDLQRTAEEYARQTGETLDELVERLLTNVAIRAPGFAVAHRPQSDAPNPAEELIRRVREKYNLQPLPPDMQELRGVIQLSPDADYKAIVADMLWERYNSLGAA